MSAHPFGRAHIPARRTATLAGELGIVLALTLAALIAVVLSIAPQLALVALPEAIADLRLAWFGK